MKIENSNIGMVSERFYQEKVSVNEMTMVELENAQVANGGVISRPTYNGEGRQYVSSIQELKSKVLEMMLARIQGCKNVKCDMGKSFSAPMSASGSVAVVSNSGVYTKKTMRSEFYMEREVTAFTTTGMVKLADGREIDIDFTFEMSRRFETSVTSYSEKSIQVCDPLVLNFNGDVAELSNQKFLFDLDCDGEEEEISYLQNGSGFLALDENDDGVINDGSELFGALNGDGFADLSRYDIDKNGWIDENDEVFSHLKVWTKDKDGKDVIVSLKKAGVGAIYLGSADTQFALKNQYNNNTNGIIRKSGVYLMESGEVNTIQHVDFAV